MDIHQLFAHTRVLCFGRYAITVPEEAEIEFADAKTGGAFTTYPEQAGKIEAILRDKWEKVDLASVNKPILIHNIKDSPVQGARYIWYYGSSAGKELDVADFFALVPAGKHAFGYVNGNTQNDGSSSMQKTNAKFAQFAKALRARENTDVPKEPGYCIDHGFVAEQTYQYQETVSVGFYFPSLPDVRFNVESNQMAYDGYKPEDYADQQLLRLTESAQKRQGGSYGFHSLRTGKRQLKHWTGEESLLKAKSGKQEFDFQWSNVSKPGGAPASPAVLRVSLRTGGQTNPREPKPTPLKNEEAIALFDKLLEGFKYRVAVPGAPAKAVMFP